MQQLVWIVVVTHRMGVYDEQVMDSVWLEEWAARERLDEVELGPTEEADLYAVPVNEVLEYGAYREVLQ